MYRDFSRQRNMINQDKLKINWSQPDICMEDYYSLRDCFKSKWISQGEKVKEFENQIAYITNRKYCIAVN